MGETPQTTKTTETNGGSTPAPDAYKLLSEALDAQRAQTAALERRLMNADAKETIAIALTGNMLPDGAKDRVRAAALADLPLTEAGELDTTKLTANVGTLVEAEAAYLRQNAPPVGVVVGMGSGGETLTREAADEKLAAAFGKLGLSEAGVKAAIGG